LSWLSDPRWSGVLGDNGGADPGRLPVRLHRLRAK
jgi:hypothetical protein